MGKFSPTPEQKKAFKDVISVIKKAKKLGLVFYGKSEKLVAYTTKADDYIEQDFSNSLGTGFSQVENLSESILSDSGADDYGSYRSLSDEKKFS